MSIPNSQNPALPENWRGSTYLNSTLQTYDDVAYRVKVKLGFPSVDVEIADEAMASFIDEALEFYTRYAGYTEEYIVWCTTNYERGLGIRLDKIVSYNCYQQPGIHVTTTNEVTSTSTSATEIASVVSLLSSTNFNDGTGQICLTYDPANIWNFNVCSAGMVEISAAPVTESLICSTTALLAVNDGLVTIYSTEYNALEAHTCEQPLSAYWGCGIDITSANWVHVSGLPPCTLLGDNPITTNNGKLVTLNICNTALDTQGPVLVDVMFKNSDRIPSELYGTYNYTQTTGGFKVCLPTTYCVPQMIDWGNATTIFSTVTSDDHYGCISECIPDQADVDLDEVRKVLNVSSIDRGGTFGGIGENYLYGMDYAIAQNLWGGTATAMNIQNKGFDFVTYELLGQYIDMAKRMLARTTQYVFNKDTQYLKLYPEPKTRTTNPECQQCQEMCYVISCYIEKPIAHMLKERWVHNYVLSLAMISLGHVRGKFGSVTLFGGGTINASDVMTQGLELRDKLEDEILNNYGDSPPPLFLIG